jgi:hypothetical protein
MSQGGDDDPCDTPRAAGELSVGIDTAGDPALLAEGWVRRNMVEPRRSEELIELYESLGLEVLVQAPEGSEFGEKCQACAVTACSSYILIYTRRTR